MFNRSRKSRNRTVTPITAPRAAVGLPALVIAFLAVLIGVYLIVQVLTGAIEPEVGSAVAAIAAATIAAVASVVRWSSSAPEQGEKTSTPALK